MKYTVDAVLEMLENGFHAKAHAKEANRILGKIYDNLTHGMRMDLIDHKAEKKQNNEFNEEDEKRFEELYWGLPDLHNWKEKHHAVYAPLYPVEVETIEELAELRNAVKNAPVVPVVKNDEAEARIMKDLWELKELKEHQFVRGIRLTEHFGNLMVWGNVHICCMANGTKYLRCFWYLHGELTALRVILAVAEKHKANHPELYEK